jgi:hypothetical protein
MQNAYSDIRNGARAVARKITGAPLVMLKVFPARKSFRQNLPCSRVHITGSDIRIELSRGGVDDATGHSWINNPVLEGTEWLPTSQVGLRHRSDAVNPHASVSRWQKEGKVFSILHSGRRLYPKYIFDELGNPLPAVQEVLNVLDGYLPLRIASWFESTNAMLAGKRPREVIDMKAAGLEVEDLFADDKWDYPRTRQWALWIWANMPEADGLFWMSRRDNRSEVIMLFGDRVRDAVVDDKDSQPIAHHEDKILELLSEMSADIMPNI